MMTQDLLLRLAAVPLSVKEATDALKAALEEKGYPDSGVSFDVKLRGAEVALFLPKEAKGFRSGQSSCYLADHESALVAFVRAWGAIEAMPHRRTLAEPVKAAAE